MLLREVIDRIQFNISTLDELSDKSINNIFNVKNIVYQLTYAMDKYALQTQAIEGIYSIGINTSIQSISMPPLAIRTDSYRLLMIWVQGLKYIMDIPNLTTANVAFPYPIPGITRWVLPWQDILYLYPNSSAEFNITALTSNIGRDDTTITVDDANNFIQQNGYFSIGDEKIKYSYVSENIFYGCERGIQDTTATAHSKGEAVNEDNCWIFYFKKNFRIPMYDNNIIDKQYLDRPMEICDEHMEMITDYTSYKLLSKVDSTRAEYYKGNFDEWLLRAKADVAHGRSKFKNTGDLRNGFFCESSSPYQGNV